MILLRPIKSYVRISDRWDPPRHYGLDLSACVGTEVYAAISGIAYVLTQPSGFGLYIRIQSTIDGITWYVYTAHLDSVCIASGQAVTAGQQIGASGNSGNTTGPHLHFEVRTAPQGAGVPTSIQGAIDPEPLIQWEDTMTTPTDERGTLTTLHVQQYADWMPTWCGEVGTRWAKIVNPSEDTVDPLFPGVENVLVRFWCDDTAPGYIARGYEGGRAFVRDQADRFRRVQANGKVLELWNEPDCNTNEGLIHLREATLGAIDEANALGITLCILNVAEGNPHDNNTGNEGSIRWKWNELLPAIKAAIRYGHYLGRHCYWRPDVEGPTGLYHALGRLVWDIQALRELGADVDTLKVLVNETGIDGGIAGHTPVQGWRILTDAATYLAQIVEAERYAREYLPQVRALMLFTSGYEDPWGSFEHDVDFCGSLIGPLRSLTEPAPPVIPAPRLIAPLRREDVVRVTQRWNPPAHYGVDYSCYEGCPVFAGCDGIAYRGSQTSGFGYYVRIEDGSGLYVYLAHLRAWAVPDGSLVQAGDLVGYSGNTGNSTGPHLHYEVRRTAPGAPRPTSAQGAIDPEPMLYWPEDAVPEPLPNDEQGDAATLMSKCRWWMEEETRQRASRDAARADEIHASNIELAYRLEGML